MTEEFARGMEAAAKIADAYADENFRMATDTILLDPVLKSAGREMTCREMEISHECLRDGCIHSSMAHAAQNIAAAIRASLTAPAVSTERDE